MDQAVGVYGRFVELRYVLGFENFWVQLFNNSGLLPHQLGLIIRLEHVSVILRVILSVVKSAQGLLTVFTRRVFMIALILATFVSLAIEVCIPSNGFLLGMVDTPLLLCIVTISVTILL